jgi:hypothetical protein
MELSRVTIQGHPDHSPFDVEVPADFTSDQLREHVNSLDLSQLKEDPINPPESEPTATDPAVQEANDVLNTLSTAQGVYADVGATQDVGQVSPEEDAQFLSDIATELGNIFGPGADIKDAVQGSSNIMQALKSGDAAGAALGVAQMAGGLAGVVIPGSQKIKALGKRTGKTVDEIKAQGGPLSTKFEETQIGRILDEHKIEWEYAENGGVTAFSEGVTKSGKVTTERKHFGPNTSLKTIRNWLGY